jgi:hypothetical protein
MSEQRIQESNQGQGRRTAESAIAQVNQSNEAEFQLVSAEQSRALSHRICEDIADEVQTFLSRRPSENPRQSKQLAYLIRLLPHIAEFGDRHTAFNARLAFRMLTARNPDLDAAGGVLRGLAVRTRAEKFEPAVWMLLGLSSAVLFWLIVGFVSIGMLRLWSASIDDIYVDNIRIPVSLLLISILGGGLGSVVSAAINFASFEIYSYSNIVLFLMGFVRPLIGMSSALLILALLRSGSVIAAGATGSVTEAGIWMIFAFSFAGGFTERFAVIASRGVLKTGLSSKTASE